jgi:hypothetical protein
MTSSHPSSFWTAAFLFTTLSGCGLIKLDVNGKVPETTTAPEATSQPSSATTSPATAVETGAKSAPETWRLPDDMTVSPHLQSTLAGGSAKRTIVAKADQAKKMRVYMYGADAWVSEEGKSQSGHFVDLRIPPASSINIVAKAKPGSQFWLVASDESTHLTEHDVFGVPTDAATVDERALSGYSPLRFDESLSENQAILTAALFRAVAPKFFLYGVENKSKEAVLLAGEPVLLLSHLPYGGSTQYKVLRANGDVATLTLGGGSIAEHVTTTAPSTRVMPPVHPIHNPADTLGSSTNDWVDEQFMDQAAQTPRIASYKKRKEAAQKCAQTTAEKLDPDGRAGSYDIVTRSASGGFAVESYGARISRQVDATCQIDALWKERDAIGKEVSQAFAKREADRLESLRQKLSPE